MKTELFQFCGHCWVFQYAGILSQYFHGTSFRIWNSSTGIPSPPLALFIVMLLKAHLTFAFQDVWLQVSDHTFVVIWVMKIFFVQFFCVFLPPLLNIFSSVRSIPFLSFIVPIVAWNVPLVSLIFLKRSLVFPILLFSSISLRWSLRKAFLSLLAVLWNSAFKWVYLSFFLLCFISLLFTAISYASSDNHFALVYLCLCVYLCLILSTTLWG